jgi:hypothetical protein
MNGTLSFINSAAVRIQEREFTDKITRFVYSGMSRRDPLFISLVAAIAVSNTYKSFPSRHVPCRLYSCNEKGQGQACDIFRGDWVPDPNAPYYTNDTCSVIHEHYDCMRFAKPDLGFVLWRWRPDGCDLPRLDPVRFLAVIHGLRGGTRLARQEPHAIAHLRLDQGGRANKHTVFCYTMTTC